MKSGKEEIQHDELDAVYKAMHGNADAFEMLVMRYEKQMLNIAYRMTGSYEDACEVVQDSFVSAFRGLGEFGGRSKFSTWLAAIVMNLSRNRIRQVHSRSLKEGTSLDDPVDAGSGTMRKEAAASEPNALEAMERGEMQEKVQGCIKALDPDFREVMVLRDMQEFSYGEICGMLKIPEGTLKSRLSRARDALKNCLKKILGDI